MQRRTEPGPVEPLGSVWSQVPGIRNAGRVPQLILPCGPGAARRSFAGPAS